MLNAVQLGTGRHPVVFLHGFLGAGRNLQSLAKAWVQQHEDYHVWLVDLPGHGLSAPLPGGADLWVAADIVRNWARGLPVWPVSWVGHSLGARLAVATAHLAWEKDQHLTKSITMLDISPSPKSQALVGTIGILLERFFAAPERAASRAEMRAYFAEDKRLPEGLIDWVLTNLMPVDDNAQAVCWRLDRLGLRAFHLRQATHDLWPAVAALRPRTAIACVRGDKSAFIEAEDVAQFAALACPVYTIADAGHFLHIEQPESTLALLEHVV